MSVGSHFNRGQEAFEKERWPEAVFHLEMARKETPDDIEVLFRLGNALKRAKQFERAVDVHKALIALAPHIPEALSNLAGTYLAWGRIPEAETHFEKALQLRPDDPELLFNLGTARQWNGDPGGAVPCFQNVVERVPAHHRAWANLGSCLKATGALHEARAAQQQSVALDPSNADYQWNLSLTELLMGELEEGFKRYEWRRRIKGFPSIGGRPWQGEPLTDQPLVVYTEQGMGDTLQFLRYLPLARSRANRIILMSRPSLITLLKESFDGVDDIVPTQTVSDDTITVPLMSLPHLLGDVSFHRSAVPYLRTDSVRFKYWEKLLASEGGLKVGLCWQGNPGHRDDSNRSVPLAKLKPLLANRDVRFFSLQKHHGVEQLDEIETAFGIVNLGDALDEDGSFVDTAAVIDCMDIVITVDTAVAHLSGALGKETWTLLPYVPDFRWGLGASRYYPTMRLFRQPSRGDWDAVAVDLQNALYDVVHPARCLT